MCFYQQGYTSAASFWSHYGYYTGVTWSDECYRIKMMFCKFKFNFVSDLSCIVFWTFLCGLKHTHFARQSSHNVKVTHFLQCPSSSFSVWQSGRCICHATSHWSPTPPSAPLLQKRQQRKSQVNLRCTESIISYTMHDLTDLKVHFFCRFSIMDASSCCKFLPRSIPLWFCVLFL